MALVQRVEPVGHPVAERDRLATHCFRNGGVLALGVTGHIHPATERDRPSVETLGEAGLARTDDAGEDEVRRSDEPPGVEDPRVVDEGTARVQVLADEDALAAQTAFGKEGIRAGQGC